MIRGTTNSETVPQQQILHLIWKSMCTLLKTNGPCPDRVSDVVVSLVYVGIVFLWGGNGELS